MLGTRRPPSRAMPQNWITFLQKQEKKEERADLRPRKPETPNRNHAPTPYPAAGSPEARPVILPPHRAPPRVRDRSGAFLPRAAPASPHRHLALFFPSEAAAVPRHRSRSFQASRTRDFYSGLASWLFPRRLRHALSTAPGPYRGSAASAARSS